MTPLQTSLVNSSPHCHTSEALPRKKAPKVILIIPSTKSQTASSSIVQPSQSHEVDKYCGLAESSPPSQHVTLYKPDFIPTSLHFPPSLNFDDIDVSELDYFLHGIHSDDPHSAPSPIASTVESCENVSPYHHNSFQRQNNRYDCTSPMDEAVPPKRQRLFLVPSNASSSFENSPEEQYFNRDSRRNRNNNDSSRRSREKKKRVFQRMEQEIVRLSRDNAVLAERVNLMGKIISRCRADIHDKFESDNIDCNIINDTFHGHH